MKNRIFVYSLFKITLAVFIIYYNLFVVWCGISNWLNYLSILFCLILIYKSQNDLNRTLNP